MNVGLYSEKAREDIVAAQRFVAEKGFKPTADDIRRCREEFERLPADSPLRNVMLLADFYSMSDLRDMLFHVQEHRMTPAADRAVPRRQSSAIPRLRPGAAHSAALPGEISR